MSAGVADSGDKTMQQLELKFNYEEDKILLLLVLTDFAFITLHILYRSTSLLPSSLFSLEVDLGYGEFFQYMKEFWVVVLFFILGLRKWKSVYINFSLLFLYFLADDSLAIHERFGAALADFLNFQPVLGLRAIDFGELAVFVYIGAHFVILTAITYYRSDPPTRTVAKSIILMILLLAFFGVGFDMIHIIVDHPVLTPVLGLFDDGGEMLVMSWITWFVFRLNSTEEELSLIDANDSQPVGLSQSHSSN